MTREQITELGFTWTGKGDYYHYPNLPLGSVTITADDTLLSIFYKVYQCGVEDGKLEGRYALQIEIKQLLGIETEQL